MRYDPEAARRAGPPLEDALGQVPGLPFVANDKAPRPPGGADAAIANLHYPDAEQIRAGLDAVLPQAAAGGIPGFEDDAEVEYGWGKENVRLFDYSKPPLFWVFSLAFLGNCTFPKNTEPAATGQGVVRRRFFDTDR